MNSIFELTAYYADTRYFYKTKNTYRPTMDKNFRTDCQEESLGFYSSIDKAQEAIKDTAQKYKPSRWNPYWLIGFIVEERPLNPVKQPYNNESCIRVGNDDGSINSYLSITSYDSNGNEIAKSDHDCLGYKKFTGRDKQVDFQKGEIVFVLSHRSLCLAKILELPFTKETWQARFKPGVYGDSYDDCYLIMTPNGHDHPHVCNVFKWTGILPDIRMNKFNEMIEKETKYYLTGE